MIDNFQFSFIDKVAWDMKGMSANKIDGHHDALVQPHLWLVKDGRLV
jgi:hypothetical protein